MLKRRAPVDLTAALAEASHHAVRGSADDAAIHALLDNISADTWHACASWMVPEPASIELFADAALSANNWSAMEAEQPDCAPQPILCDDDWLPTGPAKATYRTAPLDDQFCVDSDPKPDIRRLPSFLADLQAPTSASNWNSTSNICFLIIRYQLCFLCHIDVQKRREHLTQLRADLAAAPIIPALLDQRAAEVDPLFDFVPAGAQKRDPKVRTQTARRMDYLIEESRLICQRMPFLRDEDHMEAELNKDCQQLLYECNMHRENHHAWSC